MTNLYAKKPTNYLNSKTLKVYYSYKNKTLDHLETCDICQEYRYKGEEKCRKCKKEFNL